LGIISYTHPPKTKLIEEQKISDHNPLYELTQDVALHN